MFTNRDRTGTNSESVIQSWHDYGTYSVPGFAGIRAFAHCSRTLVEFGYASTKPMSRAGVREAASARETGGAPTAKRFETRLR